ncbi:MAG TPA: hypothetical protein VEK07_03535 [Polyangiaceae bacterium]|nr:hypothetical protein [Polyangiaceae bacterium]
MADSHALYAADTSAFEMLVGYAQYAPRRFCGNGYVPLEFDAVGGPQPLLPELDEPAAAVLLPADVEPLDWDVLDEVLPPAVEPPETPVPLVDSESLLVLLAPLPSEGPLEDPAHP